MSIDGVDNNFSIGPPKETVHQDVVKRRVLDASLPPIAGRIKRLINPIETLSLGYVLDKKWNVQEPMTTGKFMSDVLGLGESDVGHDAEMKIHESVFAAYKTDYEARLAASTGNVEEQDRLKALWTMKQRSHEKSKADFEKGNLEIHLGGVPELWLPDWVKTFSQQASTPK